MFCILPYYVIAEQSFELIPTNSPQMLRVLLSRLNVTDRLDILVDGAYTLSNANAGEATMIFERGSELTIIKRNDSLYVYYKGMSWNAGNTLFFTRFSEPDKDVNGLRLMSNTNIYEGNLTLTAANENIRLVLSIHLEDYLQGVVPYEMSDAFPLEALKAQAIAARTYAARRMNTTSRDYDVVDTTNDQVYMGKNVTNKKALQAIEETRGVVAFYNGQLAQCFYTASNGGQTEKASHVWGGEDLQYLTYIKDEYDIKNPLSVVKKSILAKKAPQLSESIISIMLNQLEPSLKKWNMQVDSSKIRIDEIDQMSIHTPLYNDGSHIVSKLTMRLKISGKHIIDEQKANTLIPVVTSEQEEEYSLFNSPKPNAIQSLPGNNMTVLNGENNVEATYSDFISIPEKIEVTLPIFPDLDNALGISINSSENEVITLEETNTAYILSSRRYGHGVGMSQRGAEYMAGVENKSYIDIMNFYYPGIEMMQYQENAAEIHTLNPEELQTPGPKPTPTAKPTLMPVTQDIPEGAWLAKVTEITDDSSLNLRKEPNTASDIIMRLYKYQLLIVLERCQEEGFVKVRTDATEGYVMESFLTKVE